MVYLLMPSDIKLKERKVLQVNRTEDVYVEAAMELLFLNSSKRPVSHPLMETSKTTPQAIMTTLRKSSGGPDHPGQFVLNPQLTPALQVPGVTHGVPSTYLYLIIILKSLPRRSTSLIYIIYNSGTGMFP